MIPNTNDNATSTKNGEAPEKELYLSPDLLDLTREDRGYEAFYMSTESIPTVNDNDYDIGQAEATASETNGVCNLEEGDLLLADLENIRVRAAIQLGLLAHATSSLCESIPLGVVSSESLGEMKDAYPAASPYEPEGSVIQCAERGLVDMVFRDVHQVSSAIMSRFVQPSFDTSTSFSAVKKKQRLGILEDKDLEKEFDALSVDSLELET